MRVFVVVDMQNDFITGKLANKDAQDIIPRIEEEINKLNTNDLLIFTRDTHDRDYLKTQEGKKLPIEHCIKGTFGWQICKELKKYITNNENDNTPETIVIDKYSFGSCENINKYTRNEMDIVDAINIHLVYNFMDYDAEYIEEIILVGTCTDICVISNAMILKAAFPETPIKVISEACAGTTPEHHKNAIEAMKMCQIDVI